MRARQSCGILLVGDDVSANERLRSELLARSYEIVTARHGEEGLEKANSRGFDVVVADLSGPRISGLDLLRLLRPTSQQLLVMLIDSEAEVESTIEGTKLGVFEYVTTPFATLELVEHIVRAASNSHRLVPVLEVGQAEPAQPLIGSGRAMR